MKLLCAWCEKEGKPALIAEVPPLADPTPTHGMCPAHREEAEKELEALREKVEEDARRAVEEVEKAAHQTAEELRDLRKRVDP